MVNSPDFWSVLKALQAVPEMSDDVFSLFESVVVGNAAALTTDNYEFVIAMLGEYATAGSIGAQEEQRRDIALRRGKGAPPKKAAPNPVVTRGLRAVQMVGEVTGRVPHFIKQSHLEAQEGMSGDPSSCATHACLLTITLSVVSLLDSSFPHPRDSITKSVPRHSRTITLHSTARPSFHYPRNISSAVGRNHKYW